MQIEAGKYYRTRDGRKVGPTKLRDDPTYRWVIDGVSTYDDRGRDCDGIECAYHLVEEWVDGPVREVTRKEIVPGVYGIIDVPPQDEINDRVFIEGLGRVNAAELRAAAATFIEIAAALEPKP